MSSDFSDRQLAQIERTTRELGRRLFDLSRSARATVLERRWWDDRIMAWAMQDESVKVQMFRFIDVLPMLRESQSVTRHLHEYFQDVQERLPSAMRVGLGVAPTGSIAGRALAIAARRNALSQARRFIAGESVRWLRRAATASRESGQPFFMVPVSSTLTTLCMGTEMFPASLSCSGRSSHKPHHRCQQARFTRRSGR